MGGGSAGTDNLIGGRQAATLLTKATWVSGGLFLALALMLSVMSSRRAAPESVLQGQFQQTAPAAPPPVLPGIESQPAPATGTAPEGGTQPQP
jgi:preprotein translocase subunit SecG